MTGGGDMTGGPVRAFGDAGYLIDVEPQLRHAAASAVRDARLDGVLDIVPGERSVLVTLDARFATGPTIVNQLTRAVADLHADDVEDTPELVIAVRYDGPDLDDVAMLTGLTAAEVVARHAAGSYVVAFLGFAPGFAYLDGLDPALRVPRLTTPRTRVEPGAVAIAGDRACVYPRASPGGWRVIGHTDLTLFDPAGTPPSPLAAGRSVRFVACDA